MARNRWNDTLIQGSTTNTVTNKHIESVVCPGQIMEGVVARPEKERYSEKLQGRLVIKAVSVEYLLRQDGTEHK